jgi:hypothetical protein
MRKALRRGQVDASLKKKTASSIGVRQAYHLFLPFDL